MPMRLRSDQKVNETHIRLTGIVHRCKMVATFHGHICDTQRYAELYIIFDYTQPHMFSRSRNGAFTTGAKELIECDAVGMPRVNPTSPKAGI